VPVLETPRNRRRHAETRIITLSECPIINIM
jgi:hypothetical protein